MSAPAPPAMGTAPTPESLALSANLFTSQIAAWIPASFAAPTSSARAEAEWQAVLARAGPSGGGPGGGGSGAGKSKERLGLGHPDLETLRGATLPGGGAATGSARGLAGLERSLKRSKYAAQEGVDGGAGAGVKERVDSSDEEEESRTSIKKRKGIKGGAVDMFGFGTGSGRGAKARKAAVSRENPAVATPSVAPDMLASPAPSAASASASADNSSAPVAAPAPAPAPAVGPHPALLAHSPKSSKNARKKLRKKQRKLAAAGGVWEGASVHGAGGEDGDEA